MTMAEKLQTLWPEIVLLVTAFGVMLAGLSRSSAVRKGTFGASMVGLVVAAVVAIAGQELGVEGVTPMALFMKVAICGVGLLLLLAAAELPDESIGDAAEGEQFNPRDATRGEFFGFFLLSLIGAMLCAGADDLIWLFLALELTSLPTYILVAISRRHIRAPEAGIKYFFLGAMSAAIFLYGFALLYGATGSTYLYEIAAYFGEHGVSDLAKAGLVLSVIGICFKIAAVPMHFYAADVYEGAATPVTAFLAFVPKAAGMISLILLMQTINWVDDDGLMMTVIGTLAVLTMFVGNVMALLQDNVKRVLAYSSIAHSGYMMVGLAVGPRVAQSAQLDISHGVAAVLFYLVAYGVMNLGAFAVLGVLKFAGEEAETFDDLRGLHYRRPILAAVMAICALSLTGVPPLVGFWGKMWLVGAAISVGQKWFTVLAVLTVVNTAISAYYYLRLFGVCYLESPREQTQAAELPSRSIAAIGSAVAVLVLSLVAAGPLATASRQAGELSAGAAESQPQRQDAARPVVSPLAEHGAPRESTDGF